MNLRPLIDLLRKEQKIHEKILAIKTEERQCLATGDAETLLKVTEKTQDLVDELTHLEEKRMTITGEIALQLGIEKAQPTLRDILEVLPPENNMELERAGSELRQTIDKLQQSNQSNKNLLNNAIAIMNSQFSELIQEKPSGVYNRQGHKGKAGVPRAGLNVRA